MDKDKLIKQLVVSPTVGKILRVKMETKGRKSIEINGVKIRYSKKILDNEIRIDW